MPKQGHLKRKPDSKDIPQAVKDALAQMLPYAAKGYPESTSCAALGFNYELWCKWCGSYPALRQELKRAEAERLMAWQDTVEAGAQGWQAAATLLERRDPGNWSRTAQSPAKPKASPLARALGGRGRK